MATPELDGNEVSWYDGNTASYTTNFGQVQVSKKTGKSLFICVGLGRNQGNTEISFKYVDGQFIVYKSYLGDQIHEFLCSKNYPYKRGTSHMPAAKVLQIIQMDDNDSVAGIIAKRELVRQIARQIPLDRTERQMLQDLYKEWRKPIVIGKGDRHGKSKN